jgi:HEAT repeat protein
MPNYLTNEDLHNFGPEMLDLAQRAALHAVAPNLQGLEQQNADLREQVARATKRSLDQELERAVPNWREVNRDPRFIAWLAEPDTFSARTRKDLIDEATARGDSVAVVAFFRAFLQEAGASQAPGQGGVRDAVPAGGRRYEPQPSGRIYTRAEVARLMDPRRRGKKTDVEWARLQNEIITAGREGRIVGGLDPYGK